LPVDASNTPGKNKENLSTQNILNVLKWMNGQQVAFLSGLLFCFE
jgi:hypothetical protein